MANRVTSDRATSDRASVEPKVVLDAHRLLDQAAAMADDGDLVAGTAERFRVYYLAALRTAGAALVVLESRRRPPRGERNAWTRLVAQAGFVRDDRGLGEHARYFAGHSVLRQRIENGLVDEVEQAIVARMRVRLSEFLAETEAILADYEQGREVLGGAAARRSA
ncbi:SAV_6107 family HEPN domain-containing protein [Gordonia sp. (in: high G+C Gram-positive bacteria)]|uniref:SAV_6107 family HEPN domain-containing protein n=1 Tax=Gordonia sp. (in: high G+C Gram-positive bacteria) TaxID=84139 RepID=UPI0039E512A6